MSVEIEYQKKQGRNRRSGKTIKPTMSEATKLAEWLGDTYVVKAKSNDQSFVFTDGKFELVK